MLAGSFERQERQRAFPTVLSMEQRGHLGVFASASTSFLVKGIVWSLLPASVQQRATTFTIRVAPDAHSVADMGSKMGERVKFSSDGTIAPDAWQRTIELFRRQLR